MRERLSGSLGVISFDIPPLINKGRMRDLLHFLDFTHMMNCFPNVLDHVDVITVNIADRNVMQHIKLSHQNILRHVQSVLQPALVHLSLRVF